MPRPFLEEMTWEDVEAYLRHDDRLILVFGSTEQHGRHLTFATDSLIPYAIGQRVSEATGVILAPPVAYGMSLHHLGFPGSLSLRPQTLVQVATDILESAAHHGFCRILLLNGHGGNTPAIRVAMSDALDRIPDLTVMLRSWWTMGAVEDILEKAWPGQYEGHSAAGETSVFLALRADLARMDRAAHSPHAATLENLTRFSFRENYPHGVIGSDPKLATAQTGQQILDAAVQACIAELEAWGVRPGAS